MMLWLYLFTVALSLHSVPSVHTSFFPILKILSSLPLCAPLPHRLILYIQKYMQSIFMPFHQTSLISLRLNPQPDNAWRRPVLYRSIRLSSSLQGKWSVGNVMYMAQGLRKHSVFRQPYVPAPTALRFTTATYIHVNPKVYQQHMYTWRAGVCWAPNRLSVLFKWLIFYML